jgi:hypothetical protein
LVSCCSISQEDVPIDINSTGGFKLKLAVLVARRFGRLALPLPLAFVTASCAASGGHGRRDTAPGGRFGCERVVAIGGTLELNEVHAIVFGRLSAGFGHAKGLEEFGVLVHVHRLTVSIMNRGGMGSHVASRIKRALAKAKAVAKPASSEDACGEKRLNKCRVERAALLALLRLRVC